MVTCALYCIVVWNWHDDILSLQQHPNKTKKPKTNGWMTKFRFIK